MKLHGATVILINKTQVGLDGFKNPIYAETEEEINNVLITPASADDVISSTDLYGKKAVYILGIPKGDTHIWEDKEVRFFGKRWKTFGISTMGIEELIPLEWNKKVQVEIYE